MEHLRTRLHEETLAEYNRHGFQPPEDVIQSVTNNEKILKQGNFELDLMYNKINQISTKINYKKKGEVKQLEAGNLATTDPDIFNIVTDDKDYMEWKNLTTEAQLDKAQAYFEGPNSIEEGLPEIPLEIQTNIINLIQDGA